MLRIYLIDLLKLSKIKYTKGPAHGRHPLNGFSFPL